MQEISIIIDGYTNCLKDNKTGKEYDTQIDKIDITSQDYKGWIFDWSKAQKIGTVYALRIKGDNTIQGLVCINIKDNAACVELVETAPHNYGSKGKYAGVGGHLFAEAAKQSLEAGYDGFIYFQSKTNLISYYEKTIGATHFKNGRMSIFPDEAKILYERYYGGKNK